MNTDPFSAMPCLHLPTDPVSQTIHRLQNQAHRYAELQKSIIYHTNIYNQLIKHLCTFNLQPKPENAALEVFGPEPTVEADHLLPMTKEYWKEKKGESLKALEAIAEKGKACLWVFIEREAKIRGEVLAFKEELRKTLEEKGLMGDVGEMSKKGRKK